MANAQLERQIERFERRANLKTIPAIIANDGISPYAVRKPGHIRVQIKSGEDYLPSVEVALEADIDVKPSVAVRLGMIDGALAVVRRDSRAIRISGSNPLIHNGADRNAGGFIDATTISILKAVPTSPPSTSLVVLPAWLQFPDGLYYFGGEQVSLSSEIAALTSGYHQLVGLFVGRGLTIAKLTSTEQDALDPIDTNDLAEVYDARSGGVYPAGYWKIASGQTDINSDNEYLDGRSFLSVPPPMHSTTDVSNPPTDDELDTTFGTPSAVGAGFLATVNDNAAGTNVYMVASDGTNWWHSAMTKALAAAADSLIDGNSDALIDGNGDTLTT